MNKGIRRIVLALGLLLCASAHATEFSAVDYDLYSGDFNGDGKSDILYIAKKPGVPSGIALADANGVPQTGFQSWASNYLNISWSSNAYNVLIGDFNGDGQDDILLQSKTPGNSYILTTNTDSTIAPVGQILGIKQSIPQNLFGIAWSADQSHLIVGDFDGDRRADLFFQATTTSGTNAIVLSDRGGTLFTRSTNNCWSNGPQQCWSDSQGSHWGFAKWSAQSAVVTAGDFNHDGKTDLLVQPKPKIVLIDYDISIPVPTFAPKSFGIVLAQPINASTGQIFISANQFWNWNELGANWSPTNTKVIVGDFNGDGYADVFLQSKSGVANKLLLNIGGASGQLTSATTLASNVAGWTGGSFQILTGKFGGSSRTVMYLQSASSSGSNYITSDITQTAVTVSGSTIQVAAIPAISPQQATAVGSTSGNAAVTATGSASYSIPLNLPTGTGALTPKLSIAYDQRASRGLLGRGWNLKGLSSITRCPKTLAQDGIAAGVTLDDSDAYCLDGNKLRLTAGSYAADGSQYRTESEMYSLVTVHRLSISSLWFEVMAKDGTVSEYGHTADSLILANNPAGGQGMRVWALNRIHDRATNYIDFSYVNDTANLSYRPDKISYAGNVNSAVAAPYTVKFSYEARPTGVWEYYVAGNHIVEPNRMTKIELQFNTSSTIRTYTFAYSDNSNKQNGGGRNDISSGDFSLANPDVLKSIQECSPDGCFAPTLFSWTVPYGSSSITTTPQISGTAAVDPNNLRVLDINGDGCTDAVSFDTTSNSWKVQLGVNGGGCKPDVGSADYFDTQLGSGSIPDQALVTDVDGDGKADLLVPKGSTWWWLHQKIDGTFAFEDLGTPVADTEVR